MVALGGRLTLTLRGGERWGEYQQTDTQQHERNKVLSAGYSFSLLNSPLLLLASLIPPLPPSVTSFNPPLLSSLSLSLPPSTHWPQTATARKKKRRGTRGTGRRRRRGGGGLWQQECGTSVFLRTISLFSYFSSLQQTDSRLHSRKRNRGPLNPTPLSEFSSSPPSLPSLSTSFISLLSPSLVISSNPPPPPPLLPLFFLLHSTKQTAAQVEWKWHVDIKTWTLTASRHHLLVNQMILFLFFFGAF